ncbi:4-hydroxy-tetrahydrodipicolinate synthase [Candidatus Vidania fulgoroideorum]
MRIKGNITSIVTPMKKNKKIDYKSLKRIIFYQKKKNIKNIVVLGSTGESSSISTNEKIKILKFCKQKLGNKMNIIYGNCCNSTKKSIKINKKIDSLNIKAILQIVPYYSLPTQSGIYKHFLKISKHTKTPIIIYDVPKRTGVKLGYKTIEKLSKIKKIIGIKHSSNNILNIIKMIKNLKTKKFSIFCGDDLYFHLNFILGSSGNISVASNLIPKKMNQIYKAIKNKDIKKANQKYYKIFDFLKILNLEVNPIIIKYLLSKIKIIKNTLRLPLTKIKKKNKKLIKKFLNVI